MISAELSLIKERLERILPNWTITDEMEAISKISHFNITESQMNQIFSLGLTVSGIYRTYDTMMVSFSRRNP